jgi:hypothetical protein
MRSAAAVGDAGLSDNSGGNGISLYPRFWISLYTKTLRQRTLSRPPAVARKDGDRVRRYSRPGNDLTYRFTPIVASLVRLRSRS